MTELFEEYVFGLPNVIEVDSTSLGNSNYLEIEDNGQAIIVTLDNSLQEEGIFIRLQSWDENKKHVEFKKLLGKRIRISIEILN